MKAGPSGRRRAGWKAIPHPDRLAPDHPQRAAILARHQRAVAAGLSTYVDPATGYTVLTAAYLAERGYCCSNGCRHCPWEGGEADPEVLRAADDPDDPDHPGGAGTGKP